MPVRIRIPSALRRFTSDSAYLEAPAGTVRDVVRHLLHTHADLKPHLLDAQGKLRNFVNIYVNENDIRTLQGEATQVKDGDEVMVVPAIAGGAGPLLRMKPPASTELSRDELVRYSRHLLIPEVGVEGQKRLKRSSALIVGAGGLGSPLAQYLAAAGVGRLGIVDFDTIDLSNLQRQTLYTTDQVGQSKAEAAKRRLEAMNPNVRIDVHKERLTSANALDLVKQYDVVVDGTDNFPTRYLVNDACVLSGKPNVYASIYRFEGQVSVFWAAKGPCYRCLYPTPPPPGLVPSCAEGGVLGVLPGIVGSMQASEALKVLLGIGEPLIGRLLLFDALDANVVLLKLRKDPECSVCGPHPTVTQLIDYEDFCGLRSPVAAANGDLVTPQDVKRKLDRHEEFVLLDVREPFEYELAQIPGSRLLPMREVPDRLKELDATKEIVVHCHHGGRAMQVAGFLRSKGFAKVRVMDGGIAAWSEEIDPTTPTY
jgi:sulfur-carrier protein adenylyltransferase/sulfurtransferase